MKRSFLISVCALALTGCVSLGLSQQDSETAYTLAATTADVFILSNKAAPDAVGQLCLVDMVNYQTVTATRNTVDGVNYAPADKAHNKLQEDGARLNPQQCVQDVS